MTIYTNQADLNQNSSKKGLKNYVFFGSAIQVILAELSKTGADLQPCTGQVADKSLLKIEGRIEVKCEKDKISGISSPVACDAIHKKLNFGSYKTIDTSRKIMFRHSGTHRTPNHNLKLATLLGLTAGFVNAEGFLGFSVLTTNITGHAALLAEGIAHQNWQNAQVIVIWMLLFLAGAFTSGVFLSLFGSNQRYSYSIPIVIEIVILIFSGLYGYKYDGSIFYQIVFAGSLLFAMGLQNALVSLVSGSVVRTTHLTGIVTDLGIELAQLLNKNNLDRAVIHSKIKLKLFIICSFISGAIAGAYLFQLVGFSSFYVPAVILAFALLYDIFRINVKRYYRTTSNAFRQRKS